MGKILCATRGGEASYATQDKAIALAKERADELLFLFVMDLHFLDKTAEPIVVDVENDMEQMGEFLLLVAKERAAKQGVEAKTIYRTGELREELKKAARTEGASLVVLGQPAGEVSAFHKAELEAFAREIAKETGVDVRVI